jgi:sarcosine oxidase subunit beta
MTDIKIIGGGVIGLTTAVVVKRKSNASGRDVSIELIEKNKNLGDGSTNAAGCGLRTVYMHPSNVELARKGIQFWRNASSILDKPIGFRQNGYVFLTNDMKTTNTFEKETTRQKSYGIPTEFHSPPQSVDSIPQLSYDNYHSLLYSPKSSLASPDMIVESLVSTAKTLGIKISSNQKVENIERKPRPKITLRSGVSKTADYVVNATGAWSHKIAGMVDTKLPIWTTRRRLSKLDAEVSPDAPLVVDVDTGVYFLPSLSGDILAGGNLESVSRYNPNDDAAFSNNVSDEWVKEFDSKSSQLWDRLSNASVEESWTGLYTMTESRVPIVDLDGKILHMTGFSGHGIMQAPGAAMIASRLLSQSNNTSNMIQSLSKDREDMEPDIQF